MVLASIPRGKARLRRWCCQLAVSCVVAAFGTSCVVLPEVEEKMQGTRTIVINKAEVKPSLLAPVKIDLRELGFYFEISAGIETTPQDLGTEIYWYYDFDPDLGLPIGHWQTCGGQARCFLTICNRPNPDASRHHLWVVVSNGNHKPSAKKPFEFQDGVVFDAVVWEIEPEKGTKCVNN